MKSSQIALIAITATWLIGIDALANECVKFYGKTELATVSRELAKFNSSIVAIKDGATFNRSWSFAKIGYREYAPTGSTLKAMAPHRRLRGDYNLPTIGLELTAQLDNQSHSVKIFGMTGRNTDLQKMAAVLKQMPPAFIKSLDSIELWPTSEAGDFTMLGHGFLLQDPQPGSALGTMITALGGALRTYGSAQPIIVMTNPSTGQISLKISSDVVAGLGKTRQQRQDLADQTAAQVKFNHRDIPAHDHIRRMEAAHKKMSQSIADNSAIASLLVALAPKAFDQLSDVQQKQYADAVRNDGGLSLNSTNSKDWSWDNIHSDFVGAINTIAKETYAPTYLEETYPNRLAFIKNLFGY